MNNTFYSQYRYLDRLHLTYSHLIVFVIAHPLLHFQIHGICYSLNQYY